MLELMMSRRSAPALTTPAPAEEQLRAILAAAASVPDHGRLRPYRFVVVAGEARRRFGAALREAALVADADPVTVAKASRKPMFGPLQVVIIASPKPHATVPVWEQEATAALTGYAMELAAATLGVGAAWKSGHHLDQEPIRRLFALVAGERLLGWVNLGTTTTSDKPAKQVDSTRPDPLVFELRADPLMSVDELAARLDDPSIRVCDVRWFLGDPDRGRQEYLEGHIPGAIAIDLETDLSDHAAPDAFGRHPLPDPRPFRDRMGALGIGADDVVVAYDDGPGTVAARLWWMLDALGHRGVRVLDGGLAAWRAAGLAIETGEGGVLPSTTLRLADDWPRVIDRDQLRERLGSVALLDVRAGERYRGEVEPVDPVPGHIPTARNAPAGANTAPDGRLRSPEELRERFASLTDELPVVVSCGSGVTACQTVLAMRVAGLADPVLYAGSYSDWVNAGFPVATGSEPGPPV
jgi:thiosulfate/3-mercaptopyruvate sulfurtransferase